MYHGKNYYDREMAIRAGLEGLENVGAFHHDLYAEQCAREKFNFEGSDDEAHDFLAEKDPEGTAQGEWYFFRYMLPAKIKELAEALKEPAQGNLELMGAIEDAGELLRPFRDPGYADRQYQVLLFPYGEESSIGAALKTGYTTFTEADLYRYKDDYYEWEASLQMHIPEERLRRIGKGHTAQFQMNRDNEAEGYALIYRVK